MRKKILDALERLYNMKEYGYGNPVQTRPKPERGFTGEDPMLGDEAVEKRERELEDEKKEREDEIEKSPGDISKMRPAKK